jgi:hypothetical protein
MEFIRTPVIGVTRTRCPAHVGPEHARVRSPTCQPPPPNPDRRRPTSHPSSPAAGPAEGRRRRGHHRLRHRLPRGARRRRATVVWTARRQPAPVRPDAPGRPGTDRWSAVPSTPRALDLHVEAWGDPSAPGGTTPRSRCPPASTSSSMLEEGALVLERAPTASPTTPAARRAGRGRHLLRDTARPPEERLRPRSPPDVGRGAGRHPVREPRHPVTSPWPCGRARARALRRLVRVLPALRGRDARCRPAGGRARSAPPPSGCRRSPRWASTSSTCRRSTRSARVLPQGPNNTLDARARRPRLALGDRLGGGRARRGPPRPRHDRGLRRFVARTARARPGGRPRPRAAVPPRTTRGSPSTPSGSPPRRRVDRLRREPAEEVPGHLPAQLRQRPRGPLRRGAARRPALDGHGVRIFRVDNPHTKPVEFWEWLIAEVRHRPRRASSWPRPSPAGDDAHPRPRSASSSPTPTSPGATPSGSSTEYAIRAARTRSPTCGPTSS